MWLAVLNNLQKEKEAALLGEKKAEKASLPSDASAGNKAARGETQIQTILADTE